MRDPVTDCGSGFWFRRAVRSSGGPSGLVGYMNIRITSTVNSTKRTAEIPNTRSSSDAFVQKLLMMLVHDVWRRSGEAEAWRE